MESMLVRLKRYDPRKGNVLRRFTYRGIKFHEDRGWYRVDKDVADYLRGVRQRSTDVHSPPAFDVCTTTEAKKLEAEQEAAGATRSSDAADIKVSTARPAAPRFGKTMTTEDLPEAEVEAKGRKAKKG